MNQKKRELELKLLVLRCQSGDRAAFQDLVQLWSDRLFLYVRRLVQDEHDAWDVIQQTWIRVIRGIRNLKDIGSFSPWIYRIARNAALNHHRAKRYRDTESLQEDCSSVELGESAFEDAELVYLALDKLKVAHQEVLTLFFLKDLSVAEIGIVLGVPTGTVKSRLHYAKSALREVLKQGDIEP